MHAASRFARAALRAALILALLWGAATLGLRAAGGAQLLALGDGGVELARQRVTAIDLALVTVRDARELRFEAVWDPAGAARLRLRSDGRAELRVDGRLVAATEGGGRSSVEAAVPQGGAVEVRYFPAPGSTRLRVATARADPRASFEPLDWRLVAPHSSRLHAVLARTAPLLRVAALATGAAAAAGLVFLLLRARRRDPTAEPWRALPAPLDVLTAPLARHPRRVWIALGLLLTVYAAALRFEALVGRYWSADAPAWAQAAAAGTRALRPGDNGWGPAEHPYLGDPFSYLQFAREPRGFYAAHVREPLFVNATRAWLWLAGGRDLAVNLASASFSVLVVPALLLLGGVLGARWAGLLAAFCWTIEWQVVELSVEGWRDDAFAFFVTLSAWALLRLQARPGPRAAVLAGVVAAAACLTRITSLSFLLPVGLVLAVRRGPDARTRRRMLLVAAGVTAVLVLPFLLNCWRVFGDPFYAINAHTTFYRARSGAPAERPEGWIAYVAGSRPPLAALEMLVVGVTGYPFDNKWRGFDDWLAGLGTLLRWLALAGLVRWTITREGRTLLLLGLTSTLPYAFTWDIPGGAEWRFTLHAYPLLLLAAATAFTATAALDPARRAAAPDVGAPPGRDWRRPAAAVILLALAGVVLVCALRRAVLSEAMRRAGTARVDSGWRQALVFGRGWSSPREYDRREVRAAQGTRAALDVPLAAGRAHELQLRLQAQGASTRRVRALLDGRELGTFDVAPGPEWTAPSLHAPAQGATRAWGALELEATDGQPLDVALWFVAVTAVKEPGERSGT